MIITPELSAKIEMLKRNGTAPSIRAKHPHNWMEYIKGQLIELSGQEVHCRLYRKEDESINSCASMAMSGTFHCFAKFDVFQVGENDEYACFRTRMIWAVDVPLKIILITELE